MCLLQLLHSSGLWVTSRDLHGIIDRGNRGITAVKTAVMGTGSHFYRGSGGNGDSFLGISNDFGGKPR